MSTVNTSFLIVSNTHGLDIHENTSHKFRLPLPKVDLLLHCGDLTQVGGQGPYRNALKMLGEFDAELKLVIAGNYDLEFESRLQSSRCRLEKKILLCMGKRSLVYSRK